MNPIRVAVLVRSGALLSVIAAGLADLAKSGHAKVVIEPAGDEHAQQLVNLLQQRGVAPILVTEAGFENLPPADQLETWGLGSLLEADGIAADTGDSPEPPFEPNPDAPVVSELAHMTDLANAEVAAATAEGAPDATTDAPPAEAGSTEDTPSA